MPSCSLSLGPPGFVRASAGPRDDLASAASPLESVDLVGSTRGGSIYLSNRNSIHFALPRCAHWGLVQLEEAGGGRASAKADMYNVTYRWPSGSLRLQVVVRVRGVQPECEGLAT